MRNLLFVVAAAVVLMVAAHARAEQRIDTNAPTAVRLEIERQGILDKLRNRVHPQPAPPVEPPPVEPMPMPEPPPEEEEEEDEQNVMALGLLLAAVAAIAAFGSEFRSRLR